ncbi:MAG: type II secretion system protein [Planctomycetota bacterium]|jgi:prepilin-type N-terminal cleavage/methylation domain-containing protein
MSHAIRPAARGFTLIELLIVISILGVLAAVLLPQVLGVNEAANIAATEANLGMLEGGVQRFQRKHGIYPPDDLKAPEGIAKATWKGDNGVNTGIESLVCFLSQSQQDGLDLTGLAERFANTDGDDHGVELPLLKRRDRPEITDHWQTPLAYFGKFGMERAQVVKPDAEADTVQVKAKRRADGVAYGAGKFQLLSAGPDQKFGTDDDIHWPAN